MPKKASYGNDTITSLKGADRVRKRPAVIFGSDGLEGCQHSIFEILSNSIDEAREGYGDKIVVTRFADNSVEIQDFGRGIPVDYNEKEKKFNWELVFCELYAGGKYNTNSGGSYEFSLGLNSFELFDLICEIEEHFGIEIPDRELMKLVTLGDLVRYIDSEVN